jgi:hypothetical protein
MNKSVLLIAFSTIAAVLLCEAALRLVGPRALRELQPVAKQVAIDKDLDVVGAARYVAELPAEPGTDRRWFSEDPPPLTSRERVSKVAQARYDDFVRRGIYGPQAQYLWNRLYVQTNVCAPNSMFKNYPRTVLAFDPPERSVHPYYRFPINSTLPSGLVTNQFGLRGPQIALAKPPKTIRIAFVGASTTINSHNFAFSYPEHVVDWLNRFAAAQRYDVRFEVLNAGREGINSEDIAPIVREEIMPLDPDIVVYYEGANQFGAGRMVIPPIPPRSQIDAGESTEVHRVPKLIRAHSVLGELTDRALNGFVSAGEPRKPLYKLVWPLGVDPKNPDVNSSHLPSQLPIILKNLDNIRETLRSNGGQLVLCSFEWLASDNLALSPNAHKFIYQQLNTVLWPLRYADIRRLADFQNLVFRRYAESRRVPYLKVAELLPQDPNLFIDAIHMTEVGERLKAWIVFQQLIPTVRQEIESGRLPRRGPAPTLPAVPSFAATEVSATCNTSQSSFKDRIDGVISLDEVELAYHKAMIERGHPLKVITSDEQAAFAASWPISMPPNLQGPRALYLRARVLNGQIGLGVLDIHQRFQTEVAVDPSSSMSDIYVPVFVPDEAVALIIRNVAGNKTRSQIVIEDVALMATMPLPPDRLISTIGLDLARPAFRDASLHRDKAGLMITTGSQQWAYAAALPIERHSETGLKVVVRAQVLEGRIGFGILTEDRKSFIAERIKGATSGTIEVALPLPVNQPTGGLIILNAAMGMRSRALIQAIEIRRAT